MKSLTYGVALLVVIVIGMNFAKGAADNASEKVEQNLNNRFSEEAILGN